MFFAAPHLLYNLRVSHSRALSSALVFLLCLSALAQKDGKTRLSYKLLAVRVTGAKQVTDGQVIAAAGLKIGQFVGENDFKQAMQKLGGTGLFTNLAYSYHYSPEGCDVEFQITENTELVPIIFQNLVWFSDDDLISQLHSRVPLFNGRLPLDGNLADQVSDALNAILGQRNIAGKAEYLRAGSMNGPIDSYVYKINFHPVLIRNIDFPGAESEEMAALHAAATQLAGHEYLRTDMLPLEKHTFLPVFLARGYLKASFSGAQVKVAQDGPRTLVDVFLPVAQGKQYKLAGMQWQGNAALPSQKLQELIHLKVGDPANAVQLSEDLESVQKIYGTKGYIFARVDPTPELDDANSTVAYELNVTEGDQYKMGNLELDGLDDDAARRMAAQWQIKKGEPYDNSYLARFFNITYRDIGLRRSYSVVKHESVNQQDKTVSVALHFMPKG